MEEDTKGGVDKEGVGVIKIDIVFYSLTEEKEIVSIKHPLKIV